MGPGARAKQGDLQAPQTALHRHRTSFKRHPRADKGKLDEMSEDPKAMTASYLASPGPKAMAVSGTMSAGSATFI